MHKYLSLQNQTGHYSVGQKWTKMGWVGQMNDNYFSIKEVSFTIFHARELENLHYQNTNTKATNEKVFIKIRPNYKSTVALK